MSYEFSPKSLRKASAIGNNRRDFFLVVALYCDAFEIFFRVSLSGDCRWSSARCVVHFVLFYILLFVLCPALAIYLIAFPRWKFNPCSLIKSQTSQEPR